MVKETITILKLTASEGMILTNGTDYGRVIFPARSANPEDYYEITEAEYNEILAREAKAREEAEAIKHNDADS